MVYEPARGTKARNRSRPKCDKPDIHSIWQAFTSEEALRFCHTEVAAEGSAMAPASMDSMPKALCDPASLEDEALFPLSPAGHR